MWILLHVPITKLCIISLVLHGIIKLVPSFKKIKSYYCHYYSYLYLNLVLGLTIFFIIGYRIAIKIVFKKNIMMMTLYKSKILSFTVFIFWLIIFEIVLRVIFWVVQNKVVIMPVKVMSKLSKLPLIKSK